MSIQKPAFPNPSVSQLTGPLKKLEALVQQVREDDGTIDVARLEAKVDASGDPELAKGLEAVKDAFQRSTQVEESGGCGGPYMRTRREDPKGLQSGEVLSLINALVQARSEVAGLDANHDGKLQRDEMVPAANLQGLSGRLAKFALATTQADFKAELRQWSVEVAKTERSLDRRTSMDSAIGRMAKHHADSKTGENAIKWAFRDLATIGHGVDTWQLEEKLQDAEKSNILRFIPLFGIARRAKNAPGHLNDKEIARMLNVEGQSLEAFVEGKKAEIESRLGQSFDGWLAGKDLENLEHLSDPDYQRSSSSGC